MRSELTIRKGQKTDLPDVVRLIKELAEYENAPDEVLVTAAQLETDGFGDNLLYWFTIAEIECKVVGMAFCYIRYSTWKGKSLFLEDLVVSEEYRRQGIGKALFESVLMEAKNIGARQLNWQVLDWNEPAIEFYKKFNATLDPEWVNGCIYIG